MRDRIAFLLNGTPVDVEGVTPTTTLLAWLRGARRLTGTKEGCGEGDCGACTVVVGSLVEGGVRYRPLNACIAFVPMLEGQSIWTIESLREAGGGLHPVQQAMVDCHASQCGFCTPGFVMSLYALYLTHAVVPSRAALVAALSGNLCRCTGYGPILAAAERMFSLPRPAGEAARQAAEVRALGAIQHDETTQLACAEGAFFAPSTLDDLCALAAASPTATIVSGATDVGLWVTKQGRALRSIIHTARVRDAAFAAVQIGPRVRLGGGVTHERAMAAFAGADGHPALAELWRRFAGPQVRAAGTIGGNIANGSPIGDLAPALLALDATLELRHREATRTLPLERFFLGYGQQDRRPGEIVVGVAFARPTTDFSVHKVSKRVEDDISAVCGAFDIGVEAGRIVRVRVAFGGMAAIPQRATAVEAALAGRPWTRDTIEVALPAFAKDFTPIDDLRASAAYRLQVAGNLLRRAYLERAERDQVITIGGLEALTGS
jgi:xanthine dehydrogenase small subunit